VNFIASVGHHYAEEAKPFAADLMSVLDTHATVLDPELRLALVKVVGNIVKMSNVHIFFFFFFSSFSKALMLLASKKLVLSVVFLPVCFKLFRVHDKELRKLV
jgi:hypothetical protein